MMRSDLLGRCLTLELILLSVCFLHPIYLGPDVAKVFRSSAAVSQALRSLLRISATTRRLSARLFRIAMLRWPLVHIV